MIGLRAAQMGMTLRCGSDISVEVTVSLNTRILLITDLDETHRQLLLESQGYEVQLSRMENALEQLQAEDYQLVLVPTENREMAAFDFCKHLRRQFPSLRIGLIAQRAEYIAASEAVDAVIRIQHSPAKFLSVIKRLVDKPGPNQQSFSAADGN